MALRACYIEQAAADMQSILEREMTAPTELVRQRDWHPERECNSDSAGRGQGTHRDWNSGSAGRPPCQEHHQTNTKRSPAAQLFLRPYIGDRGTPANRPAGRPADGTQREAARCGF